MANFNDDASGATPESISRVSAVVVVLIAACLIFTAMYACGGLR